MKENKVYFWGSRNKAFIDFFGLTPEIKVELTSKKGTDFIYQGQYYDPETELCYNRFRYYSPDTGSYISQDPIGLRGNNPNFYAYVHDVNRWIDPFGLTGELVYQLIGKDGVNYFGITSRDALTRMNEHIADGKIFDRMEVLAENLSHDQARSIEGALIRQRLRERADDWSDFDSIEDRLKKSGLLNKNRGRIKDNWLSENPLDDLSDKMHDKPKKVKCG